MTTPARPSPPGPLPRPVVLEAHGNERVDPWYWLRDRDDPEVVAHLEAENRYTAAVTAHTEDLQKALFEEIVSHVQETDLSVPARKGPWWYYTRTVEGRQYAIHCRLPAAPGAEPAPRYQRPPEVGSDARPPDEQVLLDENAEAEGNEFFALGAFAVSPDHQLLAYAVDTTGAERFTLRFRDLRTGSDHPDTIEDTYYGVAWANDCRTAFYTRPDAAVRPFQLWRHRLGTDAAEDELVYQEDDEHFFVEVSRTKDDAYVLLQLASKVTSEVHVLDASDPDGSFRVVAPRRHGVEYAVEHQGGRFLVVTNAEGAFNFKLVEAPTDEPGTRNWRDLVPHDAEVRLEDVEVFSRHLVLSERAEGIERLRVLGPGARQGHVIEQPEAVYTCWVGENHEVDSAVLRCGYGSLVTPRTILDYDLDSRDRVALKQEPVLGGYDPESYVTERLWATAGDGARIPISTVYRRDRPRDRPGPALLYGYGSYEVCLDPHFRATRLPLLDRGFLYAVAHVRGGGELGRPWYERGKLLHKRTTFTDFIAAAEHLVAERWTAPEQLMARGGSAGGMLVGAVANLRPDLFAAMVAEVPFVDCLTTILDESLPLTVTEWEEWGNPVDDPEVYRYMRSYSPYDNVGGHVYPRLLVTAGLNDPRVSYWEPAKWVLRLRERKTDDKPVLLKTEMGAGHMGPSGRYEAWRDEAFVLSFVLDALGMGEAAATPGTISSRPAPDPAQ
ncbi:MAG TPA: S9 family peptidase [Acidimicrobiales bacterium]|nr:S9 family peptidase [Acidimicrobiales bacterium]